ncbi:MAG TPA: alpha/beta hydrolase-fold protein [Solirubrobacteraceae bacterium]|jgi:enterochelin esterase-like enzyme|nr:alpha/beta hydrolase-fold protein [Solirubrobacteraceae bacterium]
MPGSPTTSRTQVWMDSLGEWSWPGRAAEALPLPPAWVPRFPQLEPVAAGAPAGAVARKRHRSVRALVLSALLSAVAALVVLLALQGSLGLDHLLGHTTPATSSLRTAPAAPSTPLPTLRAGESDAAGSEIDTASYGSAALGATGSFHVYLPPGYASTTQRYPVLYLLHGNDQPATAFLELGLQEQLDKLIASRQIPPLIAVMIQGGRGANNWRYRYENYVLEVQQLIDRMLPTQARRSGRAIAGDSMGGYGAMNLALGNPRRFSVVESWLGFFNGLGGELKAAKPVIVSEGLHAFVYGGAADDIADPAEDAPFAAQLRAAGASAHSAIYEGGHTMETLREHLTHMLLFAGKALAANALAPVGATAAAPTSAATGATTRSATAEPAAKTATAKAAR